MLKTSKQLRWGLKMDSLSNYTNHDLLFSLSLNNNDKQITRDIIHCGKRYVEDVILKVSCYIYNKKLQI